MIRTLLSSALCLTISVSMFAQSNLQRLLAGPGPERIQTMRHTVLRAQGDHASSKTTAPTQRIIGSSSIIQGSPNDSARYFYGSPERGSYHSPNDLNSYFFGFNPGGVNYPDVENYYEGGAPDIKCDSGIFMGGSGDVYRTVALQYNSAQLPTSYRINYRSSFTGNSSYRERYTLTYNGLGQQTELLFEADTTTTTISGGPYIQDSRQYTFYGGNPARALRDSIVPLPSAPFLSETQRVLYGYTGGNLTSIGFYGQIAGSFVLYVQYQFTYDVSNRVKTLEYFFEDGFGLQPSFKDSMTYTGANPAPTGTYYSTFDTTVGYYSPVYSVAYTLNTQGLRDTVQIFDAMGLLRLEAFYQYNSYGNPTRYDYFDYDFSTTLPYETSKFYYELHNPTSINDPSAAVQVMAYPNPVQNILALRWKPVAGHATIRVADAAGRTLEHTRVSAATSAHNLDMSRYAPGAYFVSVSDDAGMMQHLKVTKQ